MPQISIEYTANIGSGFDAQGFARTVHDLLVEHADASLANCKTRLVEHERFLIGDGSPRNAMIHLDLRILPGRSDEQKRRLGEAAIAALEAATADAADLDLQLTVEVRELDGSNYHKRRIER